MNSERTKRLLFQRSISYVSRLANSLCNNDNKHQAVEKKWSCPTQTTTKQNKTKQNHHHHHQTWTCQTNHLKAWIGTARQPWPLGDLKVRCPHLLQYGDLLMRVVHQFTLPTSTNLSLSFLCLLPRRWFIEGTGNSHSFDLPLLICLLSLCSLPIRWFIEGAGNSYSFDLPLLICLSPSVYFQYFLQLLVPHNIRNPSHIFNLGIPCFDFEGSQKRGHSNDHGGKSKERSAVVWYPIDRTRAARVFDVCLEGNRFLWAEIFTQMSFLVVLWVEAMVEIHPILLQSSQNPQNLSFWSAYDWRQQSRCRLELYLLVGPLNICRCISWTRGTTDEYSS